MSTCRHTAGIDEQRVDLDLEQVGEVGGQLGDPQERL